MSRFDMTPQRAVDADRIASKLWVGSWPCPEIFKHGFDVVVLAAAELQNLPFMEPRHVIRAPLDDDGRTIRHADMPIALEAARAINVYRSEGKRVLVTCAQGKNRSALIAALALMKAGASAEHAIEQVRTHRKLPAGFALANTGFVAFLRELDRMRYFHKRRAVSESSSPR